MLVYAGVQSVEGNRQGVACHQKQNALFIKAKRDATRVICCQTVIMKPGIGLGDS